VSRQLTPSQTVGPFFVIGLHWPDGPYAVPLGTPGAFWLRGRVLDGAGEPVPDALVETWQADSRGRFAHPGAPCCFGRCPTDELGRWGVHTVRPGRVPGADGRLQAPHLDLSVFARGLLDRVVTRVYLPDEPANDSDPVLASVDPARRGTLVAAPAPAPALDGAAGYTFDIHLQGPAETVFFDV
jgi:protocatechuate 3,4-dioxygenase alpha subunit